MRVVCAWCDVLLQDGSGAVSHGICTPCFRRLKRAHARAMRSRGAVR